MDDRGLSPFGMMAGWKRLFARHGPAIALLLFLSCLGFGIHAKSSIATVPPFFDSLSYYTKAKRVWEQIGQGSFRSTFNVEPVIRPPGATLVSYPFGFTKDYRGFYFRSVFLPITIWALALWLLARTIAPPGANRWTAVSLIAGFTSFSMFYHFDYNPLVDGKWDFCHTWGMQDCFLASLGALATSLTLLSARKRSLGLAVCGSVVAGWTLLVKPAGLLLMMLVFWTWLVEICIQHWPVNRRWKVDRGFRSYMIAAGIVFPLVFTVVFLLCLNSKYLSSENWSYMSGALKVLYATLAKGFSLRLLDSWVSPALGWHWFAFLAAATSVLGITHLLRAFRGRLQPEDWRFFAAIVSVSGGFYWWFFMAGQQIRYFFPFILVFLTTIFPDLLRLATQLRSKSRVLLCATTVAPALFVLASVLAKHSPLPLQRALGVSVTPGGFTDEIQIGEALVREVGGCQVAQRNVYTLESNVSEGIVNAVCELARLENPERPVIGWYFAFDWTRGFLASRTNLLDSHYIFFRPIRHTKEVLSHAEIPDAETESKLFAAWFGSLDERSGVRVILRNRCGLLRIVDRQKLNQAFDKLVAAHRWRDRFTAEDSLKLSSAMPYKFSAGKESLFYASAIKNAPALLPNTDMSLTPEAARIGLHVSGSEPSLQLPDLDVPANRDVMVRVRIDSEIGSHIEIRRALGSTQGFGDPRTVARYELAVGSNELYFPAFSCDGARVRITLNPEAPVRHLALEDIEVRAIPKL